MSAPPSDPQAPKPFKPRNWTKADIYRVPENPAVLIKDYGRRHLLVRIIGKFSLDNEERALLRLTGLRGIPAFHARLGPYALAMEFVDARPLPEANDSAGIPPDFADRLEELFAAMETRGVLHADPHYRNILCGRDGQPYLIDFSWAYVTGTFPLFERWILPNLRTARERRLQKVRSYYLHQDTGPDVRPGLIYRALLLLKRATRRRRKHKKRRRR